MTGEVDCSRCHTNIPGSKLPDGGMTAGYYVVSGIGSWGVACGWAEYAKPGERFVCDGCMWSDPRYVAVYGKQTITMNAGDLDGAPLLDAANVATVIK